MNNKVLIGVLVLVLLAGGAYFLMNSQKQKSDVMVVKEVVVSPTQAAQKVDAMKKDAAVEEKTEFRTFNVSAENFSFSVNEMKVKQGDTVKIVFTNNNGFHDWVLDEFTGAKTKTIGEGKSETVQFVADKKGTFEYYCSVGSHRAMGMKGNLIVE